MSDIIHRLNAHASAEHDGVNCEIGFEAAETIIDLRLEIERLKDELRNQQESEWHPDWSKLKATRESLREHMKMGRELQTEVERLKQERDDYQRCGCEVDPNSETGEPYAWCLYHRALKAERDTIIERCAEVCDQAATRLVGGKARVNQADRHTAVVLRGKARDIRALKEQP
jgi:FtsZ-binding cell division protein ZapB